MKNITPKGLNIAVNTMRERLLAHLDAFKKQKKSIEDKMNYSYLRTNLLHQVGFVVMILCSIPLFSTARMRYDITASTVYEIIVPLTANVKVQFETKNLSTGCDPVLNLISPSGQEVAADDNSAGSYAAKLLYIPTISGNYKLIARARIKTKQGKVDIYKNGALWASSVPIGGTLMILDNLRANETIQTVKLPGGDNGTHRIYILTGDGIHIYSRASNLAGGTAYLKFSTNLGAHMVFVGTSSSGGLLSLILNDAGIAGHDLDRDGLGFELETEIGTCYSKSGYAQNFDCSVVADPRDTDGDGISDGWEVLGRNDVSPNQPLPKWGANPRHKDLFIEVDFMRRTLAENTGNVTYHMDTNAAKRFVAIYGDSFTVSSLLKLYHASVLQNPDQVAGISAHLDIGVNPGISSKATMYGNWGGFNAVNAIASGTDYVGMDPNIAWKTNMVAARRGIFRYALGYAGGGGSCGNSYACAFNFNSANNSAHEWGHTMGLGHSGPYGATGDVDVNCKPNYPSIMNYAFYSLPTAEFADGNGFPSLNNAALTEWKAVSPSNTIYLDVLESVFKYYVDRVNGHVDWNRNGIFEPAGQTVRAYANYRPGADCEFTRYNQSAVGDATTTTTPVLARLSNRLYMFYTKDGALKYRYSTSSWNCPQPSGGGCANGTWSVEKDAGMTSVVGVDAINDGTGLRVISVGWSGKIMQRRLTVNASGFESWSASIQIPGSASGEPSVSYSSGNGYLLYKGTDLSIHFNRLISGQWQGDQVAYASAGVPVKSTSQWAFPSVIQAYLPWKPGVKGLYALVPDLNAMLELWYFNPSTNFWEKTNLLEGASGKVGPIHNKPSMEYVPYTAGVESKGRLYMVYITKPQSGPNFNGTVRMRMSYVKVIRNADSTLTKEEKIGLDSYFDNSWFYAYGISLFYDPAHDTNLRSVFSRPTGDPQFQVYFRPKADAINDFTYTNYDDWDVLRVNLCQKVVNPGGLVSNPIACPISGSIMAQQSELVTKEEVKKPSALRLYPNPSNGNFTVDLSITENISTNAKIELINVNGQTVWRETGTVSNGILRKTVAISSSLSEGIYMVRVIVNGKIYMEKLMYVK